MKEILEIGRWVARMKPDVNIEKYIRRNLLYILEYLPVFSALNM